MTVRSKIGRILVNALGWRTNRRIVVLESDDWGSIRMPSREIYHALLKQGVRVDRCPYCKFDSLARESDLSLLFETLESVTDCTGRPAVLTANTVVANPDFNCIREDNFEHYFFERIDERFVRIKGCQKSLDMWREGREKRLFFMQSHGREHLNVARWMDYLRRGDEETRLAFDLGVFGLSTSIVQTKRKSFLAALDFDDPHDEVHVCEVAKDGLRMFAELFGYRSKSFIAPNYLWGRALEKALAEEGVTCIQGKFRTRFSGERSRHLRIVGKKTPWGQLNLVRNASFEPTLHPSKDSVDSCLSEIRSAFLWHKPAVISTHRLNYIGALDESNRDTNLQALSQLFSTIVKVWPNVEFMTSAELGEVISE